MKALPLILLLAGCASAPVEHLYLTQDCRSGQEINIRFAEYRSAFPPVDCPRLVAACGASSAEVAILALQLPLACAYRGPYCSVVVLPIVDAEWIREHELRHLRGWEHGEACA